MQTPKNDTHEDDSRHSVEMAEHTNEQKDATLEQPTSLNEKESAKRAASLDEDRYQDEEESQAQKLDVLHASRVTSLFDHTHARTHKKSSHAISFLKKLVATCVVACLLCALAIGGYAIYLESYYTRISDNHICKIEAPKDTTQPLPKQIDWDTEYTASTYNLGFGAYTPDYTFFMDTGVMQDGTPKRGEHGRAVSKDSVDNATSTSLNTIAHIADGNPSDFVFFQEIDTDSDRSFHVNQVEEARTTLPAYESSFALNFHSGFLAYPLHDMHGRVQSGLLTMSRIDMTNATRYSYPVSTKFPDKFFDLDRCFLVSRIPTPDAHELVLVNSHLSAYDKGGEFRAQQLARLNQFISDEYSKGNYVVVGGDWNHALGGSISMYASQQRTPDWVCELKDTDVASGFHYVAPENLSDVPTCRGDDIPYEKGVTYTTTVDGFFVSDNIDAHATNVDTAFASSDHNPVLLRFKLKH